METESKKLAVIYSAEMLNEIDEYRRNQPIIPDRSAAIRELIKLGLEASKAVNK